MPATVISSTRGDPANANNKPRPERLRVWDDSPARQEAIWDDIMGSGFARSGTSLHILGESGEAIQSRAEIIRASRPRGDRFCNTSTQSAKNRVAAFIIEYKALHKLLLGHVYEGLDDMELEDVVCCRKAESPRDHFRRLMAVRDGLEFGCVCTGEAFIFLRVCWDDPRTVYP